ncbi:unnamed protein product [Orchesella dallaii]|uniref:O-acyltransferase WSD1-like N-terminal domain-containing protein n=1 Tax=Orchesella dallaii TaxID=48710 RepID=A0ABP1RY43_9HEXA
MSLKTRGLLPFLISLAFYITIGPTILILCVVNEIIRLAVSCYLQNKYNGKLILVPDGADAIWALKRKNRTRMVVACFETDMPIPLEKMKHHFEEVILTERDSSGRLVNSKLTQILVTKLGFACWKRDDKFDMQNHIRSLSSNKLYSKMEMQTEITQLFKDMNESKPQWEIVIVPRFLENVEKSETSLWIFRYQHAYLDGFSMLTMFQKLGDGLNFYFHPQNFHIPFGKKMTFYLNAVIFGPYAFIIVILNKFKSFWPRQITNGSAKTQSTYTWTNSMNFEGIQKLRKKLENSTIPTILENAFISAAKDILPDGRVPEQLNIGELAALFPYPNRCLQNRFAIFTYGINSLQNDFDRIRASKEESWNGVTGPWIPLLYFIFKLSGRMPVFIHHMILGGGSTSLMMSNLPISKTRCSMLAGEANVLEIWAFPPQPNDTGITICSAVYGNSLKLSASADSTWLSEDELERIVERIPGVLNEWGERLDYN